MRSPRVILEISPTRLEIASVRASRVRDSVVVHADRSEPAAEFGTVIEQARQPISEFVERHGLNGCGATVLYDSPTGTASIFSTPTTVAAADAESSARLGIAAGADFDPEDVEVRCLRVDRGGGSAASRHLLAIADRDDVLSSLEAMVESCGLRFRGAIPSIAIGLTRAFAECGGGLDTDAVVLSICQRSTALLIGGRARLRCARVAPIGVDAFRDALMRPIRRAGGSQTPVTLTPREARMALSQVGLLGEHAQTSITPGLTGASLIPVLQPFVERLGVEVKQSIRFSLLGGERAGLSMRVCGPGSAVPGLAEAIANSVRLPVSTGFDPDDDAHGVSAESAVGMFLRHPIDCTLASRGHREMLASGWIRKCLAAGTVIAIGAAWAEWTYATTRTEELRTRSAAAIASGHSPSSPQASLVSAIEERHRVEASLSAISKALGDAPDPASVIAGISEAVPPGVVLTSVDMQHERGSPTALIRATVEVDSSRQAGEVIYGFVDQLARLPIATGATLGRTVRLLRAERDAHEFEVTLQLVAIPAPARNTARLADAVPTEVPR